MRPLYGRSPTVWLFVVTATMITGFIAANLWSTHRAGAIDQLSASIASNGGPSVQHLLATRTVMRHMEISTAIAVNAGEAGEAIDLAFFTADDATLHRELSGYFSLPTYEGERPLYEAVDLSVARFERAVDRTLAAMERHDLGAARKLLREVHATADRASDDVSRVLDFNTEQVLRLSSEITTVRQRNAQLSLATHLFAALVALGLMLLTVRATRQQARLVAEREQLAELRAQELELFAARVAHDLKNPLSAIALRLAVAESHSDDEVFPRLQQQVRSMSRMIDGLLDFSLAGARPSTPARTRLTELIEEVAASLRPDAEASGAELRVGPCPPAQLAISPGALTSVLSNLMGNALKYVADGSGRHRVEVRAQPARDDRVRIEIEDNGPGIPVDKVRAIFEPFVRLDSHARPGLGLGLATVKRLVEAYGGAVGVHSEVGVGSRFWVELPRARAAAPEAEAAEAPPGELRH
jgi:signal transduction histidine kinase